MLGPFRHLLFSSCPAAARRFVTDYGSIFQTPAERAKAIRSKGKVQAVVGAQWGDEGKGKLCDFLSKDMDLTILCAGGPADSHRAFVDGKEFVLKLLPTGVLRPQTTSMLGTACVIPLQTLADEMFALDAQGMLDRSRIKISDRAHILFDVHAEEGRERGRNSRRDTEFVGDDPCYVSKSLRLGVRMCELVGPAAQFSRRVHELHKMLQGKKYNEVEVNRVVDQHLQVYRPLVEGMLCKSVEFVSAFVHSGRNVLLEGHEGTMVDPDLGTYPHVAPFGTGIGGMCAGAGVPPPLLTDVIGVVKSYVSRCGPGHFPTEINPDQHDLSRLIEREREVNKASGKINRIGWLDLVQLKYAHQTNHFTTLHLAKLDALSFLDEIRIGIQYRLDGAPVRTYPCSEDSLKRVEVVYEQFEGWKQDISKCRDRRELPRACQKIIARIEHLLDTKVRYVGVGPDRDDVIYEPHAHVPEPMEGLAEVYYGNKHENLRFDRDY